MEENTKQTHTQKTNSTVAMGRAKGKEKGGAELIGPDLAVKHKTKCDTGHYTT